MLASHLHSPEERRRFLAGEAATGPLWFQLYPGPDLERTREHVEAAVAAGCKAIAITVDTPITTPRIVSPERPFATASEPIADETFSRN